MIAPTPSPSPDLRAEDIFARTRVAFAERAYPSTIKYGVRISGFRNGAWIGRTYDAFEHWPERTVARRSISEEETANPETAPQATGPGLRTIGTVRAVSRKYHVRLEISRETKRARDCGRSPTPNRTARDISIVKYRNGRSTTTWAASTTSPYDSSTSPADPHENLDFGLAGSSENDVIFEPDDAAPGR